MSVHENIAFNPGVGAIDVENIVNGASEDVVKVLDDGLAKIAIAARKIHNVVVAGGCCAEETITHDAAPTAFDSAVAVKEFEVAGGGRKNATADQKRAAIERYILMSGRAEGCVIEIECAAGDFDAGCPIAIKKGIGDARFGRADSAVDGHPTPGDSGARRNGKTNGRCDGSFGEQTSAIRNDKVDAGAEIDGGSGLNC